MEEIFKFYELAKKLVAQSPPTLKLPKSEGAAEYGRKQGNENFQAKKFEKAIEFYNVSLCFSPPGSKDIPLVYGNRSAVFYELGKYALALENIELARKNGFPADKMAQLDAREVKCKKLMEKFGPDKNFDADSFFKLSHPPNEKIPFIADCLELRKDDKYGRHIITNKDLKAGDIIAIEKPVFTFQNENFPTFSCTFCMKTNSGSLIPCSHCTTVMFCSEECQAKAAAYHSSEELYGAYSGNFEVPLKMQLETYRIAGGVSEALELWKNSADKTIFDFDFSDPEDPAYEKKKLIALNGLCKNYGKREVIEVEPDLLLDIPPINEMPRTPGERRLLLKFIVNQFKIATGNWTEYIAELYGVSLLHALMSHSCDPNIEAIKHDDKLVLIISRPVKAGSQLTRSYGVHANLHPKKERHDFLQKYHFKCNCRACVNDWPKSYPKKDNRFVKPVFDELEPAAAIKQIKKNCQYINKKAEKIPCYEVATLIFHNMFLYNWIAGNRLREDIKGP